ncbi:hypothetical protein GCM10020000_52370 [Streptomyces olivoverticillatus]
MAISDLHVAFPENRRLLEELHPDDPADWLIVAGDVAELFRDVEWALGLLARRYARVVWTPGNHELWTPPGDPVQLRGEARYHQLVRLCRDLGVHTPRGPLPRLVRPRRPRGRRPPLPPLRLQLPHPRHHQGAGAGRRPRHRDRLLRRIPAPPRPLPEPRSLVPGPHRRHRTPPDRL